MKKYTLLILVLFIGSFAFAQENDSSKKLTRKEKKEIEKKENNEKLKVLYSLLENKIWIIEANEVKATNGNTVTVNQEMNFVTMNLERGVVQLALQELMGIGANNIGGVTVEGEVTKYDLKEFEDNKQISCIMQVDNKNGGFARLSINVMANGRTTVRVTGGYGVDFTFSGYLKPQGETHIIKGSSAR